MPKGVVEIPKNVTTKTFEKFFKNVNESNSKDDCWEWLGRLNESGYGILCVGKHDFRAHRFSYFVQYNIDPVGWVVRHKCDNPACCNPNHLELGTQQDNVDDMKKRGRMAVGEKYSKSKRKESDILLIRKLHSEGLSYKEISEKVNENTNYIAYVVLRLIWKHI